MPNWCYNGLTIEGNPEQVNKLVEQMNQPYIITVGNKFRFVDQKSLDKAWIDIRKT